MGAVMKSMGYARHNPAVEGVIYPEHDDFYPDQKVRGTEWAMRVLTVPDDKDPNALMSFDHFEAFGLIKPALNFMKKYPQYVNNPYESIFFVTVFEFDGQIDRRDVKIDADGMIRLTKPLDPRKIYRVCLGQVVDLSILSPGAQDRVKDDGELVDIITGKDNPKTPGGGVSDETWDQFVKPRKRPPHGKYNITFYTIIAHRRTELDE